MIDDCRPQELTVWAHEVREDSPEHARLAEILHVSAARHDHLCPRQVLGARMGLAGLAVIGLPAPIQHKNALVFIESDGCFADGIEAATGATVGHRTLRVQDLGKVAAVFGNLTTQQAMRLVPHPEVRERAKRYAQEVKTNYHAQLQGYRLMPDQELFCFQEVELDPALEAVVSRAGVRARCERCGEEIINGRQVLSAGKCLCRTCAGQGYYVPKDGLEERSLDPFRPDRTD